ncbi:protein of unknown function [Methylocaldum szegediense]|uniref:Uncharacterized protein n=1 Tax=Methylocaldum szegediense TaxID=73780 RepID=A0ABM9I613_9GAMM|nr:protein of unknown function [Methylocaldum szegediense]
MKGAAKPPAGDRAGNARHERWDTGIKKKIPVNALSPSQSLRTFPVRSRKRRSHVYPFAWTERKCAR